MDPQFDPNSLRVSSSSSSSPTALDQMKLSLYQAVGQGDLARVQELLSNSTESLTKLQEVNGIPLLNLAAQEGHEAVAKYLIDKGFNINLQDTTGNTALHAAVYRGNEAILTMLLQAGADRSISNHEGITPSQMAVIMYGQGASIVGSAFLEDKLATMEILLGVDSTEVKADDKSEALPYSDDSDRDIPSSAYGNDDASIYQGDSYDPVTLPFISSESTTASVPQQTSLTGFFSSSKNIPNAASNLDSSSSSSLAATTTAATTDEDSFRTILISLQDEVYGIYKEMIPKAAYDITDEFWRLAHEAATSHVANKLKMLELEGNDIKRLINTGIESHDPLLIFACSLGNVTLVELLITNGAKTIWYNGSRHETILNYIFQNTYATQPADVHLRLAELLIKAAPDVISLPNDDGNFPLSRALMLYRSGYVRDTRLAKLLINAWPDAVNFPDADGLSPLLIALRINSEDLAKRFIKVGANVNVSDNLGWTPLHYACRNGFAHIVRLLVQAGANTEQPNNDGNTPLTLVCQLLDDDKRKIIMEYLLVGVKSYSMFPLPEPPHFLRRDYRSDKQEDWSSDDEQPHCSSSYKP